MNPAWFVYSNDVVSGPFSTEQVRVKLQSGQLPAASYIWWKGQREWIPVALWESQLGQIVKTMNEQVQNPVWYVNSSGSPIGPLTQRELIENLKGLSNLSNVQLWAAGMEKWTGLFEMHDIMELLGISRRENARAPLMGSVAITRSNDDPKGFVLRAASVSIAGLGVTGSHDLRKDDELSLLVKSNEFPGPLHLRGVVAYVTSNGYAGIRFHKIPAETQSLIFDYVKRFHKDLAQTTNAA